MNPSERIIGIRADNPGIMTLDGTNTWVLRQPGGRSVVVDPGPTIEAHLEAIHRAADPIGLVIFTHHHADHTEALDHFVELGIACRAADRRFCHEDEPLTDGEQVDLDGLRLQVLLTPGHTQDSLCLKVVDEALLLTGDTVLGRGTTVIAHPDGTLGPYLESIERLLRLVRSGQVTTLLPGHGPIVEDAGTVLDYYLAHRRERLEQVRAALLDGATDARSVVERVYADVDESLWPAAERSVEAQLSYLRTQD